MLKDKKIKALIIGAGNIGALYDTPLSKNILTHAHGFINNNFNLVGFVDTDFKKAYKAAKIWNTKAYKSIQDAFYSNKGIDVVSIATPDDIHYQILKELSSYIIKLVFVEKPFTTNLNHAKEIINLYKSKNIPVAINYTRRYLPVFENLKKQIDNNIYGRYIKGIGYYGKGILHNGSHIIDLIQYLIGNITSVKSYRNIIDYSFADPNISAVLNISKDKYFILESISSKYYTIFEIDLFFQQGRIKINDTKFLIEIYLKSNHDIFRTYKILKKIKQIGTMQNKALDYVIKNLYGFLTHEQLLKCTAKNSLSDMIVCSKITSQ